MGVAGALEFRPRMSGARSLQLSRTSTSSAPTPPRSHSPLKPPEGSAVLRRAPSITIAAAPYELALVPLYEKPSTVGWREYGRGRVITPRIRAGPRA